MEVNFQRFTTMHGGRQPVVRNAYYTFGDLNPWIHQGIDKTSVDNSSHYELIPCKCFYGP